MVQILWRLIKSNFFRILEQVQPLVVEPSLKIKEKSALICKLLYSHIIHHNKDRKCVGTYLKKKNEPMPSRSALFKRTWITIESLHVFHRKTLRGILEWLLRPKVFCSRSKSLKKTKENSFKLLWWIAVFHLAFF